MKSFLFAGQTWVLLGFWLAFGGSATAETKLIRLRNETISPAAANNVASPAAAEKGTASGLFLIQFAGPLAPEARAQIASLGVDLLHYVPNDTFVARLRGASLYQLRALPFVRWVGDYRPEHKLHRGLTTAAPARAGQSVPVAILLIPRATAAEVAEVRGRLSSVKQESTLRSGAILRGQINPGQLTALAQSASVLWVEPMRPMKLNDEVSSAIVAGPSDVPNELLPQSLGYDGSGVKVAVADSGLNNGDAATMHPDLLGRTPAFFYYGNLIDAADEHSHGTHVSGIIAGNGASGELDDNGFLYGLGVAPGASIIAQRIFDDVGGFEPPPSFERLTRDATRAGAVIGSNSWGDDTQGRYDISAMEFDELVRDADALAIGDQPYILEFSAGNAGPAPQTIGSPAVAKNVIATGASENDRSDFIIYADGPEAMADFSSRGPCEDGRIKPDVVAPGTWIASLQSQSASDIYAWAPIDDNYQYQGGTSQAGPHCSGAAAVFVQYYRQSHTNHTPSPALVKAALINTADDMDDPFGAGPVPNNDEGWGRVDIAWFFDDSVSFDFVDQPVLLTNSQVFEKHIIVSSPDERLNITLTYTDPPAFPGAIPALVNDLDLEVIGPDGRQYFGNQFDNGESIPKPPGRDSVNNVEGVRLAAPLPGEYIVRVRAKNVVEDIHGNSNNASQDFALVISGLLASPGVGVISMDKSAYTVPTRINVAVVDTDLAGQPTISINIRSSTESSGETLQLIASGSSGSFTGSIATATGPAVTDGKLQVANNDSILATYFDASHNSSQVALAVADLLPPVLSSVSVANEFGVATISWNSSEPATSLVLYGTNSSLASLTLTGTNSGFDTAHAVVLSGLIPGRTYYFYVVSSDSAGNTATNTNGGSPYQFVVPSTPPVLLVDQYTDSLGTGIPPISGYISALDQAGVKYDLWSVASHNGTTPTNSLRSYRAVIWRVADFENSWGSGEQVAISNYLGSGGGLFVASMEILTRLQDDAHATNFVRNVLQVQSFVPDPGDAASEVIGSPVEPVGKDLDIITDWTLYQDLWDPYIQFGLFPDPPDLSDTITPSTNATPILRNDIGEIVGLRWPALGHQAPGRLVLLTFPLDVVPMGNGINDRVNLVRNVISFLAPGVSGAAEVSFDSTSYTLPSLVTVQVGDIALTGQGSINVTASSTTDTNGLTVTLFENLNSGVFIGSFPLIPATNAPTTGKLRAQNGDTLTARFLDPLTSSFVSDHAQVDTVPPVISGVSAEPDYATALVSWISSKPTDALVQFGESPLLGRTAYDPGPTTVHSVPLNGLVPNRTYYFQVTSRDVAGNSTTDDNHGTNYTLHTLSPIIAPWFDNLDTGATNWSFFSADGSELDWTLGTPNNGLVTNSLSLPNCWGSNLEGIPATYVDTSLISPAIYLTNGNSATLTFWHAYDFSGGGDFSIEQAEVQVVVDNGSTLIPLQDFTDFTDGWEPVQVDLTPYVGQVVYLVWEYALLSFDDSSHQGWLIDNVSVSVANVVLGSIQVSNNLFQATAVLSGPMFRKVTGLGTTITNAPPGQYFLEFADVPYYITPPSQTNTLAPGGTLSLQGTYTFADVNSNGIPDPWEMQFFGTVATNRTKFTDTDGDGMTDYAEFIAGTDPLSPPPPVRLTFQRLPGNTLRLQWPSLPGLQYRLLSASDLVSWTPYSNWLQPTGSVGQVDVSTATSSRMLFRLQTQSTNSTMPPNLKLTAKRLSNGNYNLTWASVAGRGYQVMTSTNLTSWLPSSTWLQPGAGTGSYTLSSPTNRATFFRLAVQP